MKIIGEDHRFVAPSLFDVSKGFDNWWLLIGLGVRSGVVVVFDALTCSFLEELGTLPRLCSCWNATDRSTGIICNHQKRCCSRILRFLREATVRTNGGHRKFRWDRLDVRRCASSRPRPRVQCVHLDLKGECVRSCSATSAADGR